MIYAALIPVYVVAIFAQNNPMILTVTSPIVIAAFFFAVQFEYNAFARYADALIQAE